MAERIDKLDPNPFISSPGDFLVKTLRDLLRLVPQFRLIFGDAVDSYKRMDYGIRQLPALRIYSGSYTKEFESWFINGDITLDVILPASLRREELEQVQDTIANALLQQFRRPTFFATVEAAVPGLNQLGSRQSVDKTLGFQWDEAIVPLTQITVNFRIDLRKWDDYLESTNRTKDDPFERTLADLTKLVGTIQGLNDVAEVKVELGTEQNLGD